MIEGTRYILIRANEGVEVNGVSIPDLLKLSKKGRAAPLFQRGRSFCLSVYSICSSSTCSEEKSSIWR